ncbi:hypothetical protein VTN77DRAFT_7999 [Rasamsonia byssochlamydoides]|uniref:uncharacterized protein n=1 Tax=Rasamsonia byssochlamydoides TaxID=89139 RepID=UPI003743D3DB
MEYRPKNRLVREGTAIRLSAPSSLLASCSEAARSAPWRNYEYGVLPYSVCLSCDWLKLMRLAEREISGTAAGGMIG